VAPQLGSVVNCIQVLLAHKHTWTGSLLLWKPSADLNDELNVITQSLADIMIDRKISTKIILMGLHAFLLALEGTGKADAGEISEELSNMYNCYRSLVWKH
jgi:hypothetical protein